MRTAATVLGLTLAAAIAGSADAGAAELYKWTDEKGQVHYTDTPPPAGVEAEARQVETAPDTPADQTIAAQQAKKQQGPDKTETAACKTARANVQVLESSPQVAKDLNRDGTPETLTPEQHAAELQRERELVKLMCDAA